MCYIIASIICQHTDWQCTCLIPYMPHPVGAQGLLLLSTKSLALNFFWVRSPKRSLNWLYLVSQHCKEVKLMPAECVLYYMGLNKSLIPY